MTFPHHLFGYPLLAIIFAYAVGCFNTGYYLVRWKTGHDLRRTGSRNAGAKNTGRILGPWGFGVTLLGDMAKGALVVLGARLAGWSPHLCLLVLLAVTMGHNWPVQLRFHGGKGLATSFGGLLMFDPFVAGTMFILASLLIGATRRFTLGASVAYGLSPALALLLEYDVVVAVLLLALVGLVVVPHRHALVADLQRRHATSPA
jgi:glycerol-3-phosphate acyltransferase PlsY